MKLGLNYSSILFLLLWFGLSSCESNSLENTSKEKIENKDKTNNFVNDWFRDRLDGNVKELILKTYPSSQAIVEDRYGVMSRKSYDKKGRILVLRQDMPNNRSIEFRHKHSEDSVKIQQLSSQKDSLYKENYILYLLHEDGRYKQMQNTLLNDQGKPSYLIDFEYNESNRWVKKKHQYSSSIRGLPCEETREYDSKHFLIKECIFVYDQSGEVCQKKGAITSYQNNAKGQFIEMKAYEENGNPSIYIKYDYQYDEYGNWVERYAYDTNDNLIGIDIRQITYHSNVQ